MAKKNLQQGCCSMLWRRLDHPGHEACRLFFRRSRWHLTGTAVFAFDRQPCRLDYRVICDAQWQTVSGEVSGWVGEEAVAVEIAVDAGRRWQVNGKRRPGVTGCIDLDLNFSPSTNLLPIRRLHPAVGREAKAMTAWLRFPEFSLEPLEQLYRRIDTAAYRYESGAGDFVIGLGVNKAGFVTSYPGFWQLEGDACGTTGVQVTGIRGR